MDSPGQAKSTTGPKVCLKCPRLTFMTPVKLPATKGGLQRAQYENKSSQRPQTAIGPTLGNRGNERIRRPLGAHGCADALPVLSSCHSVPFWSCRSCLLAYCGVLISVLLFSGLPAICLLVASGPRASRITNERVNSPLEPPARSHIYSISCLLYTSPSPRD